MEKIRFISIQDYKNISCSVPLLQGEIPGAEVYYHTMLSGDRFYIRKDPDWLKTLVLTDGEITVATEDMDTTMKGRGSYTS